MKNKSPINRINSGQINNGLIVLLGALCALAVLVGGILIIAVSAHAEDSFFGTKPITPPPPSDNSSNSGGTQGLPGQLNIEQLRKEASQPKPADINMSPIEHLMKGNPENKETVEESPVPDPEPTVQGNEDNENKPHDTTHPKENKTAKEQALPVARVNAEEEAQIPDNIIDKIRSQSMSPQVVNDEGMQAVEVSLKDISRIVCFTDITRVIYSKEKVIEIKNEGKDAFVKNLPIESADPSTGRTTLKYDRRPKEVYLLCGSKTYSLILVPKDIPATTIYLRSSSGERENASKFERANDYDNTIYNLIKTVYRQEIPNGYQETEISTLAKSYQQADIVHTRDYSGDMLQVQEYLIFAKTPINIDEISILEQLKIKSPLAITVIDNVLEANQQTRVIVVRFNNE